MATFIVTGLFGVLGTGGLVGAALGASLHYMDDLEIGLKAFLPQAA